jgi:hypothetical protein
MIFGGLGRGSGVFDSLISFSFASFSFRSRQIFAVSLPCEITEAKKVGIFRFEPKTSRAPYIEHRSKVTFVVYPQFSVRGYMLQL